MGDAGRNPSSQTLGASPSSNYPERRKKRFGLLRKKDKSSQQNLAAASLSADFAHSILVPEEQVNKPEPPPSQPMFGAPVSAAAGTAMSAVRSPSPPSVFDEQERQHDDYTDPTAMGSGEDEPGSYDLKPPPPSVSHTNVESLSTRLFSADHLDVILRDHNIAARFSRFLGHYRPQQAALLKQYVDAKKALTAVEYANAIADSMSTAQGHPPYLAATLDDRFEAKIRETADDLSDDALPAYITHRLVQLVTETLVKEITGNSAPIMRELIPSLAEVYCVTDPSLPDNPIVYASEEFYNTSQYGREYVIGRNCRFLQGPKTSNSSVRRMIDALAAGQEICETILNYRRDGSPFMNLLMIAPLYDNKGQVRYFLGCQIDVSSLIERGRGLESFQQLLEKDRSESRFGGALSRDPKHALGELGQMLSEDETNTMRNRSRRASEDSSVRPSTSNRLTVKEPRRRLGMDDAGPEQGLWPHPSLGPSGRLPGVYQNYLLVRPFPSLRITFTSPALRIPGLLQTKFLDRIGGPQHVREGILDSLAHGTGVTAKISWLTHPGGAPAPLDHRISLEGKPRWIHCTPLLGSDEKVGVWMIVMVEQEEVTGQLNRHIADTTSMAGGSVHGSVHGGEAGPRGSQMGVASPRYTGSKLYAEYLRREGRPGTAETSSSARERREVDSQFRDF